MFSLTNQEAKLCNVNLRSELHGDGYALAVDLSIEIKVSNDLLSEFDPTLKSSLYRAADANDAKPDLFQDEPGHLPRLRHPLLGSPLKWNCKGIGYETIVHYGVSGNGDIVMADTVIDKFRFDCQDGGTVVAKFRIIAHPTPEEVGRLSEMIQQKIELSLIPPSTEEPFQATQNENNADE